MYAWNPSLTADLFDPEAPSGKQWTILAKATNIRLYHSEALLTETGHVITAGSEMDNYYDYWGAKQRTDCFPLGPNACTNPFNYNIERFSPPYLEAGSRIEIKTFPSQITYNTDVELEVVGDGKLVDHVSMIRYSSATHSLNTDQRLVELPIVSVTGSKLVVRLPWNSALAPPGNWMIWAIDEKGVPSVSKTALLSLGPNGPIGADDPIILKPVPARTRAPVDVVNSSVHALIDLLSMLIGLFSFLFV